MVNLFARNILTLLYLPFFGFFAQSQKENYNQFWVDEQQVLTRASPTPSKPKSLLQPEGEVEGAALALPLGFCCLHLLRQFLAF
jgi:hypothetical protein